MMAKIYSVTPGVGKNHQCYESSEYYREDLILGSSKGNNYTLASIPDPFTTAEFRRNLPHFVIAKNKFLLSPLLSV